MTNKTSKKPVVKPVAKKASAPKKNNQMPKAKVAPKATKKANTQVKKQNINKKPVKQEQKNVITKEVPTKKVNLMEQPIVIPDSIPAPKKALGKKNFWGKVLPVAILALIVLVFIFMAF